MMLNEPGEHPSRRDSMPAFTEAALAWAWPLGFALFLIAMAMAR